MPAKGNLNNLQPVKTKEEARQRGRNGGIKSGEARRLKASMREVAAKWMINKSGIKIDGERATGEQVCLNTFDRVMARADKDSVELIKTMGKLLDSVQMEDLERNRVNDNELKIIIDDEVTDANKDE